MKREREEGFKAGLDGEYLQRNPCSPYVEGPGELPNRYNVDTLVLMPVNADVSFLYWEVTDTLLERRLEGRNIRSAELVVKVFETETMREVYSFRTKERVGKHYMKYQASFRPLTAEIGLLQDGEFVPLMGSKAASTPSLETAAGVEGLWMERREGPDGTVWIPVREALQGRSSCGTALRDCHEEPVGGVPPLSSMTTITSRP
ncbi:MAG: DUF4912 domain-containing protein [Nitrospirae bacterium]|nr:DUF4912 domain-containing protein [Nitrospirota bacterium]